MSYYTMNAYSGFGGDLGCCGGLGELFYDGGKAFWRVKDASETLSSIAVKVYGNVSVWPKIWDANTQDRWPQSPPGCTAAGGCKGWYKPGAVLELPLIPGYPDPAEAAPKSGMATAKEGDTIVTSSGKVAKVGAGGKVSGLATAGLSKGTMIGLGVAAGAIVLGLVVLSKKKKGEGGAKAA
jgi:hypothetical protein